MTDPQAEETLYDVKRRLAAGEDFAVLAQNLSEDKASAASGGDLGWVEPGEMIPDFEQAMDQLKPGDISNPVKTRFRLAPDPGVLERRDYDNTEEFAREKAHDVIYQRKIEEERPGVAEAPAR